MLEQRIVEKGLDVGPLQSYIDSFKHGVSPHAGAGIGLDRVVFLYLGELRARFVSEYDLLVLVQPLYRPRQRAESFHVPERPQ
jgi:hypothetical protein